jgi:hypothetical protein
MMAEDDPQQQHAVHLKESMLQHQQQIMAVKEAIKPGCLSMFKPFDKQMIKDYFERL